MDPISQQTYDMLHPQLLLTTGYIVGILFTGGLISSGISCIFLLSTENGGKLSTQNRVLRLYVLVLILLVVGFEVATFLSSNGTVIFYFYSPSKTPQLTVILGTLGLALAVVSGCLTDGVLVIISIRL